MRNLHLLAASVSLGALVASPAWAQVPSPANQTDAQAEATEADPAVTADADAPGETDIVVTGIRASLQSAQSVKRAAPQVVDAIVAEDIGKLPDLAVSDTVGRLPGVQVYRQAGEASRVLVRGLPFFTTTYNGREIFTAETRVVALQDFPSANIAALEVFKSSSADLITPGLAGLVNIRSRRPFDFQDGQVSGSVWGLYTRQAEKLTPNFNLLATKRWDTGAGEMGFLINGSYTELQYLDSEPSNTDFLQTFRQENGGLVADAENGTAARFPDIQRLFYRSGNRARPSVNASFQWKPDPDLEIYVDGLWQGFRNKIDDRLVAAELFNGLVPSSLVFRPGTNLVEAGRAIGAPNSLFTFQGGTFNKTDTYQFAGGFKYETGPFKASADVAYTDSTFRGSTESVDRRFIGSPTIDFDLNTPQFAISGIDPLNPNAFVFDGLYEESQVSAGQDWQGRLDLQYEFEDFFIRNIQVGARYTDRDAERRFSNRFARPATLTNAGTLPLNFRVTPEGFRGAGDIQPFRRFVSPTYGSIRQNVEQLRQLVGFSTDPIDAALDYTVAEKTYAGYAQLAYAFGDNLDGQVGVRVERTETRVAAPQPTGIDAIDRGNQYTDWLPNASLRYRFTPELQLRLAFSQTRTRPDFVDQRPSINLGAAPPGGVGTPSQPYPATGGNPFLRPFTSDNYDASLEYYFSPTGFASVAVFHRDVNGFIQEAASRFTDPQLGVVQVIGRTNTGRGRITGVEAQLQTFFDFGFVPDWARSFGIQTNVTYIDGKTQQPVFGQPGELEFDRIFFPDPAIRNGVSKWNFNFVGLYERGPLSARMTYTGRSNFLAFRDNRDSANPTSDFADPYREFGDPNDRLDLSVNYSIRENVTVFADWTNITMNPFKVNFTSARDGQPEARYRRYLRYDESTVSLGVRFRFGS